MSLEILRPNDFPTGSSKVFKDVVISQQEAVVTIDVDQSEIKDKIDAIEKKNGQQDIAIQQNEDGITANAEINSQQDADIRQNADSISVNSTNIEIIKEALEAVNGSIIGDKDVATVDKAGLVQQVAEASIVDPLNAGEQNPAVIVAKINEIATAWNAFVRSAQGAGIIKAENNSEDYPE